MDPRSGKPRILSRIGAGRPIPGFTGIAISSHESTQARDRDMTHKSNFGNFFEDFRLGQIIRHATPRTITYGDVALYTAIFGSRFAVQSSSAFARAIGYAAAPVDDLLVFHIVFGKTVPDISLNAIANLGYADCRFHASVTVGTTLSTVSEIIGLKENSSHQTGVVYVRSTGSDEAGRVVLDYVRWVMVKKRDGHANVVDAHVPHLPSVVSVETLGASLPPIDVAAWDFDLSGAPHRYGDYAIGERIDHVDGMTVEEAEHQIATRLYHNTAKVHFNQWAEGQGRFGRRLVYGGHVISLARALSFNGLANAFHIAAINAGRHVAPLFAGKTVFAWSQILDMAPLAGRDDVGALRIRTIATADRPTHDFPDRLPNGDYEDGVILDLDYWVMMPR
jgi:2-methylfumaryl-CoA hydratase